MTTQSKYSASSPYYMTDIINGSVLDVMKNRPIPKLASDNRWVITPTYHLRPDMLAYDLYNDSKLWWVFFQRNPNTLRDPLFGFTRGTIIYIPTIETLRTALGIA